MLIGLCVFGSTLSNADEKQVKFCAFNTPRDLDSYGLNTDLDPISGDANQSRLVCNNLEYGSYLHEIASGLSFKIDDELCKDLTFEIYEGVRGSPVRSFVQHVIHDVVKRTVIAEPVS